ncbi:hypothetical protein QTG54_003485 [Skeletonema marinoi]|uniref:Sulfotransferase domain-containing protein n=1 Tax=Skeletonema marinoi TaxID=267567 RepID=A0AAD8YI10_9STRA|nr:hypothetical protein QTG54_003485 [Skeletonema marinoi]
MQQSPMQQQEGKTASRSRRAASFVAATAGLLCFLIGTSVMYTTNRSSSSVVAVTNPNNNPDIEEASSLSSSTSLLRPSRRALSELVRVEDGEDLCSYKRARLIAVSLAEHDVSPTYQASFPGSGARMTHELIRALTGIAISTDHAYAVETNRHRHSVAVKTHYPDPNGVPLDEFDEHFNGAVLVLRHPAKAIPSFFNFWYERVHHLANHSTRAPLEEWIKFRDTSLVRQLQHYQQHMDFWMLKYEQNKEKLLVVTYEDMTDDVKGPETTARIAEFLNAAEGVQTVPPESITCIWQKVVKYEDIGIKLKYGSHRTGGPKSNPYTDIQLYAIQLMMQEQRIKFQNDPDMVAIMDRYISMTLEMQPELVTS